MSAFQTIEQSGSGCKLVNLLSNNTRGYVVAMSTALFSFLGVIVGATLQYFLSRHLDDQRHRRELRTKAYTDYLRCVCEHANQLASQRQSTEGRELGTRTADAKCRVCLYGSPSVVQAFAAFERLGAAMNSREQCAAFTRMVSIMREDSSGRDEAASSDLEVILLGSKVRD